jgi:hypothetical protein
VGKVQTRVLIEVKEINVFRRRPRAVRAFCDHCGRAVNMLTPDEAAKITGEGSQKIRFLMKSSALHHTFDAAGRPIICLFSLSSI